MYLKEVIIEGFKSFANRTKILLGPGVTTIMGPNGCGKSNIVDAIRWVLGEQSAKALRGGKMNDVIFEGTDKRNPLSFCEVSLIFSDCEKELGTTFHEVQITRRVSRDGGGNYYINSKACRLKDIHQLFMNTGVRQVSYSFMVQGQIDQILSTNPAERRIIFEEAAGITRYKAQRREALNKLALVDQNLSRVNDVIDEVARQITSLKRQATKALRFKQVSHRLKHLDLAWNSFRYEQKHALREKLVVEVKELRETVQVNQKTLGEEESVLAEKKTDRQGLYDALQCKQQAVFESTSKKDEAENKIHMASLRQEDFKDRIGSIEKEIVALERQQSELSEKLAGGVEDKASRKSLADESDALFRENNQRLVRSQEALNGLERDLQKAKQKQLQVQQKLQQVQNRRNSYEVELQTGEARSKDLEEAIAGLTAQCEELKAKHAEGQAKVIKLQGERNNCEKKLEVAREETLAQRTHFKTHQQAIRDQDREVARIKAQLGIIEDLQKRFEGFSEATQSIMKGKLGDALLEGTFGLLTQDLEVEDAYMPAFEALLGFGMDAVLLEAAEPLTGAIDGVKAKKWGRACFSLPLQAPQPQTKGKKSEFPATFVEADAVVNCRREDLKPHIKRLLQGCYICESMEDFLAFWKESPSVNFSLIATIEGDLIDARGLVFTSSRTGKKKTSEFIKREAEIRELKKVIEVEQAKLEGLAEKDKALHEALNASEGAVEVQQKLLNEANQALSGAQIEERSLEKSLRNDEQQLQQQAQRKAQYLNTLEVTQKKHAECVEQLEGLEKEVDEVQQVVVSTEEKLVEARKDRDLQLEAVSELKVDLAEKKQQLEHITEGLNQIEQRKKGVARVLGIRNGELQSFKNQVAQLETDIAEAHVQVINVKKSLEEDKATLKQQQESVVGIEDFINKQDASLKEKRDQLHELEASLSKREIQLTEESSQERFIIEKIESDYHLSIEDIDWAQQLKLASEDFQLNIDVDDLDPDLHASKKSSAKEDSWGDDPNAINWESVKQEIDALKGQIESMGAVNLTAIEEYTEHKERHAFLSAQSKDLTESKNELVNAIETINTTSEELFKETFTKVKNNFDATFKKLFGGGFADLHLNESEDILEAGIEITARPPGTRLKSLSLLSGGQKTMTAVALLFAIYQVKPSPFCVLDELDAPLDDPNIGRFVDMLREFTQFSQFLVISHNKRTIAASDTLYGVTMQEQGVTNLVSMRFNRKDKTVDTGEAEES